MKWAKTLIIHPDQSIEQRLSIILKYLLVTHNKIACLVTDMDAYGPLGNELSDELVRIGEKQISIQEMISILDEDGQIVELFLYIEAENQFQIYVRDNTHVDILGDGPGLPAAVIGEHENVDLANYL